MVVLRETDRYYKAGQPASLSLNENAGDVWRPIPMDIDIAHSRQPQFSCVHNRDRDNLQPYHLPSETALRPRIGLVHRSTPVLCNAARRPSTDITAAQCGVQVSGCSCSYQWHGYLHHGAIIGSLIGCRRPDVLGPADADGRRAAGRRAAGYR